MPRTREQFAEMKDEKRASILKAALPLFSLNEKVSIDAISEKAKCSHGIVYHYFKNTEQIYDRLLATPSYIKLHESLFNLPDGSNYEKIEHVLSVLLDVSQKDIEKVCYLNIIIKSRDKNSFYTLFTKLVKDGQLAGSIIGGEPTQLTESIFLLLKGVYLSLILEKHPIVRVPSLETVMQLLRKPSNFGRQIL